MSPPTSSSRSGRASLVSSVKTRHISRSSVSGWASEQVVCVQKVAGASPDRWRQCVKEDPPGRWDSVSVFLCHPPITRRPSTMSPWQTSCPASAAEPLLDRGACRLQASGDSTGGRAWSRMTTTTSSSAEWCTVSVSSVQDTICQDTICSIHDLSRHNLFKTHFTRHNLFKTHFTRHDLSRHISMLVSVRERHNLFKTRSSFCHTPHVNFSGSSDRVRGVRFCHHLHSALSSDRVRGACTCCHLRSGFLGHRLRESQ